MRKKLSILALSFSLAGCQQAIKQPEQSLSFSLNQSIEFSAHQVSQFIQHGKLVSRSGFDRTEAHCRIELNAMKERKQTLTAERFEVTGIEKGEEMVASAGYVLLASLGDDPRVETMDTISYYLKPSKQNPNILRLTCAGALSNGSMMDSPRNYRPNLTVINQVLGNLGALN